MKRPTRLLVALLAGTLFALAPASGAYAQEKTNDATAINTEDGGSVFRFAFSIREVRDGVVDQTNTATAHASCLDCTTVAVAFQVIFVYGDANVVTPENKAEAVNSECTECLTYAVATQIVIDMDGKELTENGKRRLKELEKRMREVERNAANMTDAELLKAAIDAKAELIAIFNEELVPIGTASGDGAGTSTTTTSTTTQSTTTTDRTTTSTTGAPSTTTSTTSEAA